MKGQLGGFTGLLFFFICSVQFKSPHFLSVVLLSFLFHLLFASNPFIMVAHKNVTLKWLPETLEVDGERVSHSEC